VGVHAQWWNLVAARQAARRLWRGGARAPRHVLSADGNTAIVAGWSDHDGTGAAWVFARSRGIWSQQGKKLVGSGAVGGARQGTSVALSADGNVAIVGGLASDGVGSASVFTRSGWVWTQGETLVSAGAVGKSSRSVALSADGRIVLFGGSNDNGGIGAAWTFAQQAGHWIQEQKLVGSGEARKPTSFATSSEDGLMGRQP
jgi:hypothetical protein